MTGAERLVGHQISVEVDPSPPEVPLCVSRLPRFGRSDALYRETATETVPSAGALAPELTSGHGFSRADSPEWFSGVLTPEGLRPFERLPKQRTMHIRRAARSCASVQDSARDSERATHNPPRLEFGDR